MTKSREILLEIVVLYRNTESYGLTDHGENGKLVNDAKFLPGSEESDCSLTDIPDKVTRIFIIIITIILLCTAIIIILVIKIIHDINMNNIESCTNTQSSYQVCLLPSSTLNINVEKILSRLCLSHTKQTLSLRKLSSFSVQEDGRANTERVGLLEYIVHTC